MLISHDRFAALRLNQFLPAGEVIMIRRCLAAAPAAERSCVMRLLRLPIMFAAVMAVGCASRETVRVVNGSGQPIVGANVEAVSPSMNAGPNVTDANGEAPLPSNVQGARWVAVSKPGFERTQVDVPKQWPLRVVLRPVILP